MKIETTTKKFREGVKLASKTGDEIRWESTGYLSVRLLDASGSHPLIGRSITVNIPKEGSITLETDADGEVSHPDVPFQDYKLDVDGIEVIVPAVGDPAEVHERHVAAARMGFVQAVLYDAHGRLLADIDVKVTFASGATVDAKSDKDGIVRVQHPEESDGNAELSCVFGKVTTRQLASPQKVVRLELAEEEAR